MTDFDAALSTPVAMTVFPGDSEMAQRCRAFDWSATSLGEPATWPIALRTVVRICLESPFPVNLWCGSELVLIYNDAYRRALGAKHPSALGRPGLVVWSDIRADIEPMFAQIRDGGPPIYAEDARFVMARAGQEADAGQDAWFTFGLSPVRDEAGAIVAFFNPAAETTGRILGERQLAEANEQLQEQAAELEVSTQQLEEQQVELEITNQHLQEQQAELEVQAVELQTAATHLEAQVEAVEQGAAALAASDARYRALLSSIDAGFCVIAVLFDEQNRPIDYEFLETNAAFVRQGGFGDPVGRRMREIAPGQESFWFETYGRVAVTGEPVRLRHEAAALGRVYDVFAYRVDDPDQRHVAVLFTDATGEYMAARDRERLVSELQSERDRLRQAFDQAPGFVAMLIGPEHQFAYANAPYAQIAGHRPLLDRTVREAFPELAVQGFYDLLDGVFTTGQPFVGQALPIQLQPVPGGPVEDRRIDLIYQPLTEPTEDGGTRVSGILVQGRDVTEAARSAEALVAASKERERLLAESEVERRRAVEANEAKAQFLANMSHELRTPLNAIGGYAELLDMGLHGPVTPEQRGALARVRKAQQNLLGLINDILNYAKLESGRVEYDLRVVDLREVVHDAAPLIEPQMAAKGLRFEVRLPDEPCLVWADRDKLGQVLANLLSNAAKFTDAGASASVSVSMATRATGPGSAGPDGGHPDLLFLRVSDTGRGIPRDKQEAVFEPFVQIGKRFAGENAGTGLGLAISRDLARGMGGDLRVRSTEGEGATFTVSLRRVVEADGDAADRRIQDTRRSEEDRRDGQERRHDIDAFERD